MTTDPTPDLNTSLFILASLSPLVTNSLELELYRQSADSDESTDDVILADAILNTLRDLETIGLDFGLDYSILQQPGYLKPFTELLGYLLPNGLYPKLKSNIELHNLVHHLLDGGLGDNETLIQCYLSELGGLDGQSPFQEHFSDTLDLFYPEIKQTETFTDYLRNMYDLVQTEKLTPESDAEQHNQYRIIAKTLITRVSEAVNLFNMHPCYGEASRLLNILVGDLTSPNNYPHYQYIFTTNKATLPDDLQPLFDRQWVWYEVSHPWCRAYFELRHLVPTSEQLLLCYAFAYARYSDTKSFIDEANRLLHWGSSTFGNKIFTLYGL